MAIPFLQSLDLGTAVDIDFNGNEAIAMVVENNTSASITSPGYLWFDNANAVYKGYDGAAETTFVFSSGLTSTSGNVPTWQDTVGGELGAGYSVATTVGNPGTDTTLVTEQGIREALDGLSSTLDIDADTGGPSTVTIGTQTLDIAGTASEVTTSVSGQTITIGLPDTVQIDQELQTGVIAAHDGTDAITITDTTGDVGISNNLTVTGNLTVNGTTTEVSSTTVTIDDPLISLGDNNTSTDAVDLGIFWTYGSTPNYGGVFRDQTDGDIKFYNGGTVKPTTTVTLGTLADVQFGTVNAGTWNGTAISETYGGTGITSYSTGDIIYADGSNSLTTLAATTNGYVLTLNAGVPVWSSPGAPAGHNLLSASHSDTVAQTVSRGSLIYGNATPLWDELVVGSSNQFLKTDGTDVAWTSGAALTKTDDTNVTLTLGGSASTALVNAASLTLGWTGTLAPSRGGTGVSSFTRGSILYAPSANTWGALSLGTAGYLLTSDGTDIGWSSTWTVANAGGIEGPTTLGNTYTFDVYDTDAPGYVTWLTATAGTGYTVDLASFVTIGSNTIANSSHTITAGTGLSYSVGGTSVAQDSTIDIDWSGESPIDSLAAEDTFMVLDNSGADYNTVSGTQLLTFVEGNIDTIASGVGTGILRSSSGTLSVMTGSSSVDTVETAITDDDTHIPTSGAVVDYLATKIVSGTPTGVATTTLYYDHNFNTQSISAVILRNSDNTVVQCEVVATTVNRVNFVFASNQTGSNYTCIVIAA